MEYLNQIVTIKDLKDFFSNKRVYRINKALGHQGVGDDGDGRQGEYNESFIFYRHPNFPENVFFKETYQTDSYGDRDQLIKIELVEGREKTITVYEPI